MGLKEGYWSILRGTFGASDSTTDAAGDTISLETDIKRGYRSYAYWEKNAADSLAADTTSAQGFFYAYTKCRVLAAYIIPLDTLTAHDTNYATITIEKDGGDDVASQTTKITGGSGNWTANAEEALTLNTTPANVLVAAGQVLTVKIEKAAAGVIVPACKLVVVVEEM